MPIANPLYEDPSFYEGKTINLKENSKSKMKCEEVL